MDFYYFSSSFTEGFHVFSTFFRQIHAVLPFFGAVDIWLQI